MRSLDVGFCSGFFRLFRYTDLGAPHASFLKFLDPTGRVQNFFLTREKGMASAANLDMNFGER